MKVRGSWSIGAVAVLLGSPLWAHHSFAEYDTEDSVTVTGKLTSVQFTNPHIQYAIEEIDPKTGAKQLWKVAGPAPTAWRSAGWNKSDFVIGEVFTIIGFRLREDPHRISTTVLTSAQGKVYGKVLKP